ncbi:MAG: methyltransferase family protein [Promethearchaeota archaeon]
MKISNSFIINVKLLLKKSILIILSGWSYIPIIMGILIPMVVYLPLAYGSWKVFLPVLNGYSMFYAYITMSPEYPASTIQYAFIFSIEIITFMIGIFVLLSGLYHLAKGRKQKISIVKTGLYKYIRHPQNLGISLISLPFALYIPGFNDIGIRIGELFSWILFTFILTIYSNLEEHYLMKKFPEEYRKYQTQTSFFFPMSYIWKKKKSKGVEFMTILKRYFFLLLGYVICVGTIFIVIDILSKLHLISLTLFF